MASITFLGTGGGRFATVYQVRRTGGIYLKDRINVHIDPGPGAMLALRDTGIDPAATDMILISHAHLDHIADAAVAVEGMTSCSLKKRGTVAGSVGSILGQDGFLPAITPYHRNIAWNAQALRPGDALAREGLRVLATPTKHSDPTGIGFRFETSAGIISYVSDSEFDDTVVRAHKGARVLILCVTRPLRSRVKFHLSTEDAAEFASQVRPEAVVLTHLGSKLIHDGVEKQRRYVEDGSGVRTIAAEDLMRLTIGKRIAVKLPG